MANKRTFKKDLFLLLELVYEECAFSREFYPQNAEAVDELVDEAITEYNFALSASNIDKEVSAKKFYTGVQETYYAKMLNILTKLEELKK